MQNLLVCFVPGTNILGFNIYLVATGVLCLCVNVIGADSPTLLFTLVFQNFRPLKALKTSQLPPKPFKFTMYIIYIYIYIYICVCVCTHVSMYIFIFIFTGIFIFLSTYIYMLFASAATTLPWLMPPPSRLQRLIY